VTNVSAPESQAADQDTTEQPGQFFIDPQAVAVARLNLSRIDADVLESALRSELAAVKPERFVQSVWERNIRHLATRLKRLKELKIGEVYLVLTLHDLRAQVNHLSREPEKFIYAVAPVIKGVDATAVAKVFVQDPPESGISRTTNASGLRVISRGGDAIESAWLSLHFHSVVHVNDAARGNVVLAGPPNVLGYLVKVKSDNRASVNAAFAAVGDGAFQLVVAPPPVFTRAAEEVLGPIKLGDGVSLGQTISRGFQWAGFGLDAINDEVTGRFVIQACDAAGAEAMKQLIDMGLGAVRKPGAEQNAGFEDLAKLINLQVSDGQLQWKIGEQHTPAGKVREALRPVLLAQQIRLGTHQSMNNLKQIGLALHNTYDVYKAFPTPANYDKDGKPLLSWRVNILPYVEENDLYRQFRRDEPWDSEHNRKLIERMPAVYRRPFADPKTVTTPYQMPIGKGTVFQPGKKTTFAQIRDGTAKTIGLIEVDPEQEVIWTKPDDWEVDWENPTKGLAGGPGRRFAAVFLDGSVYLIPKSIERDRLRAMLTGDGGENVERAWYETER
jgi:hypothetical protein